MSKFIIFFVFVCIQLARQEELPKNEVQSGTFDKKPSSIIFPDDDSFGEVDGKWEKNNGDDDDDWGFDDDGDDGALGNDENWLNDNWDVMEPESPNNAKQGQTNFLLGNILTPFHSWLLRVKENNFPLVGLPFKRFSSV